MQYIESFGSLKDNAKKIQFRTLNKFNKRQAKQLDILATKVNSNKPKSTRNYKCKDKKRKGEKESRREGEKRGGKTEKTQCKQSRRAEMRK